MAYMFLLTAFGVLVVRRRRKIFHKILKPSETRQACKKIASNQVKKKWFTNIFCDTLYLRITDLYINIQRLCNSSQNYISERHVYDLKQTFLNAYCFFSSTKRTIVSKFPPTIKIASITKTLQIAIFSALKEIFILENEEGYVLMKLVLVDVLFILNLMEVLVKIL